MLDKSGFVLLAYQLSFKHSVLTVRKASCGKKSTCNYVIVNVDYIFLNSNRTLQCCSLPNIKSTEIILSQLERTGLSSWMF